MIRLLRISLDIFVTSIMPIVGWFLLGFFMNAKLINVFSLTYPMQFITHTLTAIFATGANISAYKDDNKNAINSGIIIGIITGAFVFVGLSLNIDRYILFMNMDVETYRVFGIYSIIQMYFQFVLSLILSKLYYREENKKANVISFSFNMINFIFLIGAAIITKSQIVTTITSLTAILIFIIIMLIKNLEKFKYSLNLLNCIKYDSVEVFTSINFFIIYLFGFSNSFQYGEKYVLAITFAALITDTQWDITSSISTVAKIDISKKHFDYKKHLKNAYILITILIGSIVVMSIALYNRYNTDIYVASVFIIGEIVNLILYPTYVIKICYLQLEYSALKTTIHKQTANFLRVIMSFLPTPFCTLIGQMISMTYQLIFTKITWDNNLKNKQSKTWNSIKYYEETV